MATVSITINGQKVDVQEQTSILEAASKVGVNIPTLCHHPDICTAGNCRVCIVEVEGHSRLVPSCCTFAVNGMKIQTNSENVRQTRRIIISLLLSEHNEDCTVCKKNNVCELQKLASQQLITTHRFLKLPSSEPRFPINQSCSIRKDDSKCIRCLRCVRTCEEIQQIAALTASHKGKEMKITTFQNKQLCDVVCTNCGQCVNHCPTGALTEQTYVEKVWEALSDKSTYTIVQTAPAVRIGIGEAFNHKAGEALTGKLTSALRHLRFDSVLDTNFTADLTIIEEGYELLNRLKATYSGKLSPKLPLITSCSPGWVKFAEHRFPELLDNISTCKSPQQMFGTLAKTYYAHKKKIDPKKIVSVSIMPCTAKKFEANRPEMIDSGFKDVDYVLTTRELASMIKQAGINFDELQNEQFDSIMGQSTGAGMIFGATGGVMEAALRTAYEIITDNEIPFPRLDITQLRGTDGIKTAEITFENCKDEWKFLEGETLKVAVANGLKNAYSLLSSINENKTNYHFIEIMACPGGCLGGGGQPYPTNNKIRLERMNAVYETDHAMTLRKSHENPEVKQLYEEFLHYPGSSIAHKLLHTEYTKREMY